MVVVAGLIRSNNRFLVTRRPEGTWMAGYWEFPGGKVEKTEDPRDALIREIREELNIGVAVGEVEEVLSYRYPDRFVILLFFRCRLLEGVPESGIGQEFLWVTPEQMLDLEFLPADRPLIERLRARHGETESG